MDISQKKKLTLDAAIVMSSLVVSRLTGFAREMLIPSMLGSNEIGDAYNLAFRITDIMYYLLVGGSISAALIPVLSGYIAKGKEKEGWDAVSSFINVTVVAIIIFCILGIIFAPQFVPLITIGYNNADSQGQLELVIELTRILFPSVAILMLAGFANGILNSYQRFAAAAFGPSLYNLLSALSIVLFSGISVQSVAFGVMVSSFIYFIFQLLFTRKNLKYYRPVICLKHPGFRRLFKLAIPSLLSSSIAQVNILITSMFTTLFPKGSIVALSTADKIWQTPYGIFAQGIGTAILPTLSSRFAVGEKEGFREIILKGLKSILFLTIPSAVGLAVLRKPIVSFFKFSELFDDTSILSAQNLLMFFTIGLIGQSIVAIINRGFYAVNDTRTPLFVGSATIAVNLLLCLAFYKFTDFGVAGMSLAYSLTSALNATMLIIILNKKVEGLKLSTLFNYVARVGISACLMGLVLFVLNRLFLSISSPVDFSIITNENLIKRKLIDFGIISLEIFIGAAAYFIVCIKLKVEEAESAYRIINNKLKKVFSPVYKKKNM